MSNVFSAFALRISENINSWRNRHFAMLDVICLLLTPTVALFLRIDNESPRPYLLALFLYTIIGLVVRLTVFYRYGLYQRLWRYADKNDLLIIALSVVVSSIFLVVGFFTLRPFSPILFPRSVPIIDSLLVLVAIGGNRFNGHILSWQTRQVKQNRERVLILGAGDAGASIAREIRNAPHMGMEILGFIDDDPYKRNIQIHGFPVLGSRNDIVQLCNHYQISQVVVAMPAVSGKELREIVQKCERIGVKAKIVPGFSEVLSGKVNVSQLRNVRIDDLLRREPVETDLASVRALIRGRTVLVTGGGGSIGSELCRQIWACDPRQLVIIGHGENSVFSINAELRALRPLPGELHAVIADIRFPERLKAVFEQYQPDVVFHAAAHKHVPLMEHNPCEAITNNIFGTRNVLDAAQHVGVERFVMISTDKAVNPTSVMGVTKRIAEMLVHRAAQATGRPYVVVRFGNVLGSRGSVVLTFRKQIEAGGPVTVTDPRMTRFFMTIPEAVQLVLQSAVLGSGDEVFVLDMGEPVKIVDLATDLIELSGLEVGRDIDIVFTGMRPGEKLYEELFVSGEDRKRTRHRKIFLAGNAGAQGSIELDEVLATLESLTTCSDRMHVISELHRLIPSYDPPDLPSKVMETNQA